MKKIRLLLVQSGRFTKVKSGDRKKTQTKNNKENKLNLIPKIGKELTYYTYRVIGYKKGTLWS